MSLEMLDPVQESVLAAHALAPRLVTLQGKVLGLYNNNKLNAARLLDLIAVGLSGDFEFTVRRGRYNASERMEEWEWDGVDACDAVILANGDCGACSSSGIANAIALEKRGIPTLLISTPPFADAVRTMAKFNGMEGIAWAVVSHPIGSANDDELLDKACDAARQFRQFVLVGDSPEVIPEA